MFRIAGACSIKTFLCEHLGLDAEYINDIVTTVLLNGRPVDDINDVMLKNGSVLALSAAMPGLAGAVIRRSSLCAALRGSITYKEDHQDGCKEGVITLKLFNTVMKDLGPEILRRGIYVNSVLVGDFLKEQLPAVWNYVSETFLNVEPIKIELLQALNLLSDDSVFLRVTNKAGDCL